MASSIPPLLRRKVIPAAAMAATASFVGCEDVSSRCNERVSTLKNLIPEISRSRWTGSFISLVSSCEAPSVLEAENDQMAQEKSVKMNNPFLTQGLGTRESVLRKRMTSIGRFSLKSDTETNPSIPVFFLALSGEKKNIGEDTNKSTSSEKSPCFQVNSKRPSSFSPQNVFTVADFESIWMEKGMPSRHPRFHSTVSAHDDRYFEETHHAIPTKGSESGEVDTPLQIKADLDRHASETMHFSVYREDLRNRLEHMLTYPLEVSEKLWEIKISNGALGSSGAISRAKVNHLLKANDKVSKADGDQSPLKRNSTRGRIWMDVALEAQNKPMESVLLFRSHHALADGASMMSALSDLTDEAEEIRSNIETAVDQWRRRGDRTSKSLFQRILMRFARFLKLIGWCCFGTVKVFLYQIYLHITTLKNPFDIVREDAEKKGVLIAGRSISWCDAAPLEEVKQIARVLGQARGVEMTVNDVFVSCVSAAVVRQLIEHEEFMAPVKTHRRRRVATSINVVVPVHLRGGAILPNETVGNNIGAFVSKIPGEMKHDAVGGSATCCPTERLFRVHQSLSFSKLSPAPLLSHYMAKFCSDFLPEKLTKFVFSHSHANACVAISNNRAYDKKLHINGMSIESVAGFVPLPPGVPIGVVVQSYAGEVSLSINAEKWAVPDADRFMRWVLDEYEILRKEATKMKRSDSSI